MAAAAIKEALELNGIGLQKSGAVADFVAEADSNLGKILDTYSLSQIIKWSGLYKLTLIYASKKPNQDLLHELVLSFTQNDTCSDIIPSSFTNALKLKDFETLKSLLIGIEGDILLEDPVLRNDVINCLLFYNCDARFLEIIVNRVLELEEDESHDIQNIINDHDSHGLSPLIASVLSRNMECLKYLMEVGADKNVQDVRVITRYEDDNDSECSGSEENQFTNDVWFGIDMLDPSERNLFDNDQLGGQWNVMEGFYKKPKKSQEPNDENKIGEKIDPYRYIKDALYGERKTALHYAICIGDSDIINVLVKSKSDVNLFIKCAMGMTPIDYAALTANMACLRLILNATKPCQPVFHNIDYFNDHLAKLTVSEPPVKKSKQPDKDAKIGTEIVKQDSVALINTLECKDIETTILVNALHHAILGSNLECVKLLLCYCNDTLLNILEKNGKTALMLATEKGWTECVELLLRNYAVPDPMESSLLSTSQKITPLMLACQSGNLDCVIALLDAKANIDNRDVYGQTALMYAIMKGRVECARELVTRGIQLEARNRKRQTALLVAIACKMNACIELLVQSGAEVDVSDQYDMDSLSYAAYYSNSFCVELFLKAFIKKGVGEELETASCLTDSNGEGDGNYKTETSSPSKEGFNPFEHEFNDISDYHYLFKRIIDNFTAGGCDPNIMPSTRVKNVSWFAERSLPYACHGGYLDCLKLLLPHCTTFNKCDKDLRTPLMNAAHQGHTDQVKLLLQHGVDVNFIFEGKDPCFSAVVCATSRKQVETLRLLLEHGADPNKGKDREYLKAVSIAVCNADSECLKLLVEHNANVNTDGNDISPLTHAISKLERSDCKDILIKAGATMNIYEFYKVYSEESTFDMNLFGDKEFLYDLLKRGILKTDKEKRSAMLGARRLKRLNPRINSAKTVNVVMFFMENDAFDFNWWWNDEDAWIILFLAVQTKIEPGEFIWQGWGVQEPITPLLFALRQKDELLVRFLLRNLYFTWDDYVNISNNHKLGHLKEHLHLLPEDIDHDFCDFFGETFKKNPIKMLCSNDEPWPLELLCLLKTSTALFQHRKTHSSIDRNAQVDSLPIPDKFKTILRFAGNQSRLCMSQWSFIGHCQTEEGRQSPAFDSFLCLSKPVYPSTNDLIPCHHKNKHCFGFGLTLADDPQTDGSSSISNDSHRNWEDGDIYYDEYDGYDHYMLDTGSGSDDYALYDEYSDDGYIN